MSPTLSNFVVDWILRQAMAGVTGVQVSTALALTDLVYADDIAIPGDNYEAVQEMVIGVHRFANALRLRINAAKPKVLSAQMNLSNRSTITWCAFGGSLVVQMPWSLHLGDRANRRRIHCENQPSASDLQSTTCLTVVEAKNCGYDI